MVLEKKSDRWPLPTPGESTIYNFNLHFGNKQKVITRFDWYEYRGGALIDNSENSDEEISQLSMRIRDSSCLMICLSGKHIVESDKLAASIKMGVPQINDFISDAVGNKQNLPPSIVIAITKYDLCSYESKNDLIEDVKEMFPALFAKKTKWLVMICPVTLGYDLAADPIIGRISPINVHYPIIFSLYAELVRKLWELDNRLNKGSRELQSIAESDLKKLFEKKKLDTKARNLNEIYRFAQSIQYNLELIGEKINMNQEISVFFDGEEVDFYKYLGVEGSSYSD